MIEDTSLSNITKIQWLCVGHNTVFSDGIRWWSMVFRSKTDSLSTTHTFHQLISQPTHLFPASFTYIDLIFTDQPNLVVHDSVHPSLHKNCHHQITFCKWNLKTESPPPNEHLVWDYRKTDTNSISKTLKQVNWKVLFQNKNVHEQVLILNKILLNVFLKFWSKKLCCF